jgi:hypothetical protein
MIKNRHNTGINRTTDPCGTVLPTEIVEAYGAWFHKCINNTWDAYLMTVMFRHIPGSVDAKIRQMHDDVNKVYSRLATRVVRKPASPNWAHFLPQGLFFPDVPAYRQSRQGLRDVTVNDGLHMHGIMVVTTGGRLKQPLDQHFLENERLYVKGNIHRIHVKPLTHKEEFVADYAGKAIKRKRFSTDDILILPKSLSEVSKAETPLQEMTPQQRAIRDLQSRHNVSDEIALSMYLTHPSRRGRSRGIH